MNYKVYVKVGDTSPEEIMLNEGYSSIPEDEINEVMDTFCSLKTVRVALANGIIIAIPSEKMRDVYFFAAPVKE